MVPKSKIWKEQWGLKWSPFFISAPFKLTIESAQWKSTACARILPGSQHHTKRRHSDVSVWSVATELLDNQAHRLPVQACDFIPQPEKQEEGKKKKRNRNSPLICECHRREMIRQLKTIWTVRNHKLVPEDSAIGKASTPSFLPLCVKE